MSKEQWLIDAMKNPERTMIPYTWEGKAKYLVMVKNKKYPYISMMSVYRSDMISDTSLGLLAAGISAFFGIIIMVFLVYTLVAPAFVAAC